MIRLSALYPAGEGARFDHDDYETRHAELVQARWAPFGLQRIEMDRGAAGVGGAPAPFIACGHLVFGSLDELEAAMTAHGDEIIGDIPNFTNTEPVIQISTIGTSASATSGPLSAS